MSRLNRRVFRPELESLETRLTPVKFTVNTLADTVAANLTTGQDANGNISLRSAIMAANASLDKDTIVLSAGTYLLTIPGANEDGCATGDLDIAGKLKIKGVGAGNTIVNANGLDRVFHVLSGKAEFTGLTIRGGAASEGAGLFNAGAKVLMTRLVVRDNLAQGAAGTQADSAGTGRGGGIYTKDGQLTLTSTVVANNSAVGGAGAAGSSGIAGGPGGAGNGGGIYVALGASLVVITNSTLAGNQAVGGAGGAGASGVGVVASGGGFGQSAFGGGLFNQGTTTVTGSTITGNLALGGAGGRGGNGSPGATGADGANGGGGSVGRGGGIENNSRTLVLANSTLTANRAQGGQGGAGGSGGTGVQILGNGTAQGGDGGNGAAGGSGRGAGLYAMGIQVSLSNVTVAGNSAHGGDGGAGGGGGNGLGGMINRGGHAGLGGSAGAASGGGVHGTGSPLTLMGVNFVSNRAEGGRGGAGGNGGTGSTATGNGGAGGRGGDAGGGGFKNDPIALVDILFAGNAVLAGTGGLGGTGAMTGGNGDPGSASDPDWGF